MKSDYTNTGRGPDPDVNIDRVVFMSANNPGVIAVARAEYELGGLGEG